MKRRSPSIEATKVSEIKYLLDKVQKMKKWYEYNYHEETLYFQGHEIRLWVDEVHEYLNDLEYCLREKKEMSFISE